MFEAQPAGPVATATADPVGEPDMEWPVEPLDSIDGFGRFVPADMVDEDSLDPEILVHEAAARLAEEDLERAQWAEWLAEAGTEQLLECAKATRRAANLAEAGLLELAAGWADRHGVLDYGDGPVAAEELVQFGGDGAPAVAEFCPAELGAAIGLSALATRSLIADALDLRHRLPRLWAAVRGGALTPWVARKIAAKTRVLDASAAAAVDAHLDQAAATLPPGRLLRAADAAVIAADTERAEAESREAARRRGFWLSPGSENGIVDVFGSLEAPDAVAVDRAVAEIARALTVLGDTDPYDVRRAKALGLLANPTGALGVVSRAAEAHAASQEQGKGVGPCAAGADPDGADPTRGVDLRPLTLYAHTTLEDLRTGFGVARIEDVGPVVLSVLKRWLPHRHVTLKPVIDLEQMPLYDCYETPPKLAEAIWLAKPADCFPFSSLVSRRSDNEHTTPYRPPDDGGPPGQTNLPAMARMGRHTHRIKTFARWKVTQPRSGVWIWRAPHGDYYLVDHAGTTPLGRLWTT